MIQLTSEKKSNIKWMSFQKKGIHKITLDCIKEFFLPAVHPFRTFGCVLAVILYITAVWTDFGWWNTEVLNGICLKNSILEFIDAVMCGYGLSKGGIILFGIIPIILAFGTKGLFNESTGIKYFWIAAIFSIGITVFLQISDCIKWYHVELFWILTPITICFLSVLILSKLKNYILLLILFGFIITLLTLHKAHFVLVLFGTFAIIFFGCLFVLFLNNFLIREWGISLFHLHILMAAYITVTQMISYLNTPSSVILIILINIFIIIYIYSVRQVTFEVYHLESSGARETKHRLPIPYRFVYMSLAVSVSVIGVLFYLIANFAFYLDLSPLRLEHKWDIIWPVSALLGTSFFLIFPDAIKNTISMLVINKLINRLELNDYTLKDVPQNKTNVDYLAELCTDRIKTAAVHVLLAFLLFWIINMTLNLVYGYKEIFTLGPIGFVLIFSLFGGLLLRASRNFISFLEFQSARDSWTSTKNQIMTQYRMNIIDDIVIEEHRLLIEKLKSFDRREYLLFFKQLVKLVQHIVKLEKDILTPDLLIYMLLTDIIKAMVISSIIFGLVSRIFMSVNPYTLLFGTLFFTSFFILAGKDALTFFKERSYQDDDFHSEETNDLYSHQLTVLKKKRQELYQSEMMATLGQMASGMAHEFNTPLLAIRTIAQATTRFLNKGAMTPQEIQENMSRIVEIINSMTGQVKHIQALAKEDHLKTDLINVNAVIKNAFDFFEQQLKSRSVIIQYDLQEDLPMITANKYRVEQIFINLIQNSKDALETVRDRNKEIAVKTQYIGEDTPLNIHFKDNGIGIKEEIKHKVFEPFFTTKDVGKGMGLGLSIVNEIVSELGGTIKCYSEFHEGTNFVIEIPFKNKES
ncbi:MAG: GHKL domain-containing protein [Desulfobacterales bacterium]|nr:GHKL domain-containing protein [Desulfobacterales bacterium]